MPCQVRAATTPRICLLRDVTECSRHCVGAIQWNGEARRFVSKWFSIRKDATMAKRVQVALEFHVLSWLLLAAGLVDSALGCRRMRSL